MNGVYCSGWGTLLSTPVCWLSLESVSFPANICTTEDSFCLALQNKNPGFHCLHGANLRGRAHWTKSIKATYLKTTTIMTYSGA